MILPSRRDHVFVQRKYIEHRPPHVRTVACCAAHRPRDGRAVHGARQYIWFAPGNQGTATVMPYCDDTLDSGVRGRSCGRRVGR